MITLNRVLFLKVFKHLTALTGDDNKFELECVYFNFKTGGVCVVAASNGHALAKLELTGVAMCLEDTVFLIHKKWLQQILISFKGKAGDVVMYPMGEKLTFTDGVSTQDLEGRQGGEYLDIEVILKNLGTEDGHGTPYAFELLKKAVDFMHDLAPFAKCTGLEYHKGTVNVVTQGPGVPLLIEAAPSDSVIKSATFAIMPCAK